MLAFLVYADPIHQDTGLFTSGFVSVDPSIKPPSYPEIVFKLNAEFSMYPAVISPQENNALGFSSRTSA